MGAIIWLIEDDEQVDISPGWNKQMATWLRACPHESRRHQWHGENMGGVVSVFTATAIPDLERFRHEQRKGVEPPPYDQSPNWTACFDRIIAKIRACGEAVVLIDW